MKRIFTALAAMSCVLVSAQLAAFFGNDLLGSKYCVVGCGRGPLGVAPIGDIIKGANEFAFGPTLDAFEQKGKNIVDYASEKADAKLLVLDKNMEQKISEISEVAQDSISQLDAVLKSNISLGIEGLSRSIESLNIVGTKQNDLLNGMLRGLIYFICFSVVLIWLAKYIGSQDGTLQQRFCAARWRAGIAVSALLIIIIVPNFIPGLKYKIPEIERKLLLDYREEFTSLSFQRSTYVAEKLVLVDPESDDFLRKRDRSSFLRDAFFNPVSYRTSESLARTEVRIASLLLPEADRTSSARKGIVFRKEPELEIALAMIVWQVRSEYLGRLQAANICAHVIERELKLPVDKRTKLLPLAVHYLSSYMVNPLGDDDIAKVIKVDGGSLNSDVYDTNYPLKNNLELKALLVQAASHVRMLPDSEEAITLDRQILFGQQLSNVYREVIPNYIVMLNYNHQAMLATADNKGFLIAQRNAAAKKIIDSWNSLLSDEVQQATYYNANLKLSLITSLSATYERAFQYIKTSDTVSPPKILEVLYDQMPLNETFLRRWIGDMEGAIRPSGVPLIRFRSKVQFLLDQDSLVDFETSYYDFLNNSSAKDKALTAASYAAKLGLFVCVSAETKLKDSGLELVDCQLAGAEPRNAVWYLYSRLPAEGKTITDEWRNTFITSLKRTIPVI